MIEKFSDFESVGFLDREGEFVFEVISAEIKQAKSGNDMVVFEVQSDEAGKSTLYHSLDPKARWSYNNLIKACLKLDTKEKISNYELDYYTVHNELIGKKFIGNVECETYEKVVKKALDDGTFEDAKEIKETFKIKTYSWL